MARLRNGFAGGFSGKVGSVIGYRYRDQDCIKGLPKISNKPPSQKQLESRARFKALNDWRNPLSNVFALTFKNHTKSHSAQNAAHRFNLGIVTGTYPNFEVDYSKAVISQGDLPLPADLNMERKANGDIQFTWDTYRPDKGKSDDLLYVLVICKTKNADHIYAYTHAAARYTGAFKLETHRDLERGPIHIYATFLSNDRERAANSVYMGELKVVEDAQPIALVKTPETPKGKKVIVASGKKQPELLGKKVSSKAQLGSTEGQSGKGIKRNPLKNDGLAPPT